MNHVHGCCHARCRCAWGKFRENLPLLTSKPVPFDLRGHLFSSNVRSSMLHGTETWPKTSMTFGINEIISVYSVKTLQMTLNLWQKTHLITPEVFKQKAVTIWVHQV